MDSSRILLWRFLPPFPLQGTAVVNLCISALDVFLRDDEWNEPIASYLPEIRHVQRLGYFEIGTAIEVLGHGCHQEGSRSYEIIG